MGRRSGHRLDRPASVHTLIRKDPELKAAGDPVIMPLQARFATWSRPPGQFEVRIAGRPDERRADRQGHTS